MLRNEGGLLGTVVTVVRFPSPPTLKEENKHITQRYDVGKSVQDMQELITQQ